MADSTLPKPHRIERPWLRRIPGYGEKRRRKIGDEGEPGSPGEAGDESPGDVDDAAGEGADEPDGEPGPGAPDDGEPGAPAQPPPNLDTALHIPPEIEQARREAGQDEQRTPWNRFHAPRAFPLEGRYLRGLATRFARMVSKLAEDNADLPSDGDDEWDLNALVRRRFTGKLPHQCRMSRDKRKVVVVLDTSPSCAHQARLFGAVAQIAEELGDCEIFDAPNFGLESRWREGRWETLDAAERGWPFRHRVVLAFGDFDGIDHICQASRQRGNRIFWFGCEERASVLEAGRETFVRQYKGKYFAANHITQLMRAMGRVR